MKIKIILFFVFLKFYSEAQESRMNALFQKDTMNIAYKIDTANVKIASLYHFVNNFINQDSINKRYWDPKYKNTEDYNYSFFIDGLWKYKSPRWITKHFYVKLVELDTINDTLAYFKILIFSNNDSTYIYKNQSNVYKFYIVGKIGNYYLDNCREYESRNYFSYSTKNIYFHCSPFLKNDTLEMIKASNQFDSLCLKLSKPPPGTPLQYYMCSNEGEMSILCNIDIWDGRVGGITNLQDKIIISITNKVFYPHEFIHAILGHGNNCIFLQEGIAAYFGGLSQYTDYKTGLLELKQCYKEGRCNFDDLYALKITNLYNSNPLYSFAGALTQYLIETIGLKKFYELYYNKQITNANFLEKVQLVTHKSKEEIKTGVEKIILG